MYIVFCYFLFTFLYFLFGASASPLKLYEILSPRTANITANIPSAWVGEPNGRGTEGLLLSCFTTLFLCAWTAYHPNVPGRKSALLYFLQRTAWMLVAVFFPETVLYQAWDQRWAARSLTLEVNKVLQAKAKKTSDENPNIWDDSDDHPCIKTIDSSKRKEEVDVPGHLCHGTAPIRRHTDPGCGRHATLMQCNSIRSPRSSRDEDCPYPRHVSHDDHTCISNDVNAASVDDEESSSHRPGSLASLPARAYGNTDRNSNQQSSVSVASRSVGRTPSIAASLDNDSEACTETGIDGVDEDGLWTTTQSLFVVSGGIAINSTAFCRKPKLTLTPEGILRLAQVDLLPKISKEDVKDRSRADAFAKIVVCTQAIWFIIQCFARVATKLPLTLLEIHTMTHIACALTMYAIWFEKPYGVESPIFCEDERVVNFAALLAADGDYFWDPRTPQCSAQHDMNINAVKYATLTGYKHRSKTKMLSEHLRLANAAILDLRERGIHYKWEVDSRGGVNLGTSSGITDPSAYLSEMIVEGRLDSKEVMWGPVHIRIAIVLFSGLYGGIHLSAWKFHFPTAGEMWAWRACGMAMLALPFLGLFGWILYQVQSYSRKWFAPGRDGARSARLWACTRFFFLLTTVTFFLYLRMYILGESLASLRSPAPGTYDSVNWTAFLPHFL